METQKKKDWFDKDNQFDVVGYINHVKSKQSKLSKQSSPMKQVVGIKDKELLQAGIFERFKNVSFQTISVDDDIRENAEMIYRYAQNIDKYIAEGKGLILSGSYGTMKTTLAVCVLRKFIEQGGSGLFIPMCSIMDNLYSMRTRSLEEWGRFEMRLRETKLLVIDDLGGEDVSAPWVLPKVNSIITERYNRKKPVIITTNMTKDELFDTYSGRIIDRLKSTNFYIVFNTKSKRKGLNLNELKEN